MFTIHQIWLGGDPPPHIKVWMDGIAAMHPTCKHIVWNDEMAESEFPLFAERRHDYTQRLESDLLRYLIICKFGGLYLDADMIPYRSCLDLMEKHEEFVCLEENHEDPRHINQIPICNAVMFSKRPKPPWLVDMLDNIPDGVLNFANFSVKPFTNYVRKHWENVAFLSGDYFYPIHYDAKKWESSRRITQNTRCIHAFEGSWVDDHE